jgi:hypothetical protein
VSLGEPDQWRDKFLDPYFDKAGPDQVVAIARDNKKDDRWHLQMPRRWVIHYNFYCLTEPGSPLPTS